jgi:hypothetical protein
MTVHLIKLCVGADGVEDLLAWQAERARAARAEGRDPLPAHVTRMWPRREAELLDGGSLFWVFKGLVLVRQRVLRLEARVGADGVARCALVLDPEAVRVRPAPRRPFQGWRYLEPAEAPPDLEAGDAREANLPPRMLAELADLGVC